MAHVASVKLEVDTLKWWLSKALPHDFGDRLLATHNFSGSVSVYLPEKGKLIEGQAAVLGSSDSE